MNLVLVLEELGYTNVKDFEVDFDKSKREAFIKEWNHSDKKPTKKVLDKKWKEISEKSSTDYLQALKNTIGINRINGLAERARQRYITNGTGQEMVYGEKASEAEKYVANGYPDSLDDYPMLKAESEERGITAKDLSNEILNTRSNWIQVAAKIEKLRFRYKNKLNNAETVDEAKSAVKEAKEEFQKV